jgi:hypothetical protein
VIQLVGLIVAAYVLTRCISEVTTVDGHVSVIGRIAYVLCFLVVAVLTWSLLMTHVPTSQ